MFAVLFQAILFGWHHHDLHFSGRPAQPVAAQAGGDRSTPDADADGCDICAALHHQSAGPGEFIALPSYGLVGSTVLSADRDIVGLSYPAAFRSRAPPLA